MIQISHAFLKTLTYWHLHGIKWVNFNLGLMKTLAKILLVEPAYYLKLQLFWSMWCPKISSYAGDRFCILPRMKKSTPLFHIMMMSCYITFKMKTSTCGSQVDHMWVTSGLFCGSVSQMGQQMRYTFNPVVDEGCSNCVELCVAS